MKRNIIIIISTLVITSLALCFFYFVPKDSIIKSNTKETVEIEATNTPVMEPEHKNVVIVNPEEVKREDQSAISASEYNNFEKTVDELITLTD